MTMTGAPLYSALLEFQAQHDASLPKTMGHQVHALFLQLVTRTDPPLAVRLHDEPGYRPFTLSSLLGAEVRGNHVVLLAGQTYTIRVTLLDEGRLWECLSTLLLETKELSVRLGEALLTVTRLISTASSDPTGWAARTSWEELASTPACRTITFSFASPTAFNMSGNYFALVPEPPLVWESLLRTWNSYAPVCLKIEKQALREHLQRNVNVITCDLSTHTLHYPKYTQKGFRGTCTYAIQEEGEQTAYLAQLATFARFAGVGYKTTMGMGQVRMKEEREPRRQKTLMREVQG